MRRIFLIFFLFSSCWTRRIQKRSEDVDPLLKELFNEMNEPVPKDRRDGQTSNAPEDEISNSENVYNNTGTNVPDDLTHDHKDTTSNDSVKNNSLSLSAPASTNDDSLAVSNDSKTVPDGNDVMKATNDDGSGLNDQSKLESSNQGDGNSESSNDHDSKTVPDGNDVMKATNNDGSSLSDKSKLDSSNQGDGKSESSNDHDSKTVPDGNDVMKATNDDGSLTDIGPKDQSKLESSNQGDGKSESPNDHDSKTVTDGNDVMKATNDDGSLTDIGPKDQSKLESSNQGDGKSESSNDHDSTTVTDDNDVMKATNNDGSSLNDQSKLESSNQGDGKSEPPNYEEDKTALDGNDVMKLTNSNFNETRNNDEDGKRMLASKIDASTEPLRNNQDKVQLSSENNDRINKTKENNPLDENAEANTSNQVKEQLSSDESNDAISLNSQVDNVFSDANISSETKSNSDDGTPSLKSTDSKTQLPEDKMSDMSDDGKLPGDKEDETTKAFVETPSQKVSSNTEVNGPSNENESNKHVTSDDDEQTKVDDVEGNSNVSSGLSPEVPASVPWTPSSNVIPSNFVTPSNYEENLLDNTAKTQTGQSQSEWSAVSSPAMQTTGSLETNEMREAVKKNTIPVAPVRGAGSSSFPLQLHKHSPGEALIKKFFIAKKQAKKRKEEASRKSLIGDGKYTVTSNNGFYNYVAATPVPHAAVIDTNEDVCVDKYVTCPEFAKNHYCTDYKKLMKVQCRKSCNFCDGDEEDEDFDEEDDSKDSDDDDEVKSDDKDREFDKNGKSEDDDDNDGETSDKVGKNNHRKTNSDDDNDDEYDDQDDDNDDHKDDNNDHKDDNNDQKDDKNDHKDDNDDQKDDNNDHDSHKNSKNDHNNDDDDDDDQDDDNDEHNGDRNNKKTSKKDDALQKEDENLSSVKSGDKSSDTRKSPEQQEEFEDLQTEDSEQRSRVNEDLPPTAEEFESEENEEKKNGVSGDEENEDDDSDELVKDLAEQELANEQNSKEDVSPSQHAPPSAYPKIDLKDIARYISLYRTVAKKLFGEALDSAKKEFIMQQSKRSDIPLPIKERLRSEKNSGNSLERFYNSQNKTRDISLTNPNNAQYTQTDEEWANKAYEEAESYLRSKIPEFKNLAPPALFNYPFYINDPNKTTDEDNTNEDMISKKSDIPDSPEQKYNKTLTEILRRDHLEKKVSDPYEYLRNMIPGASMKPIASKNGITYVRDSYSRPIKLHLKSQWFDLLAKKRNSVPKEQMKAPPRRVNVLRPAVVPKISTGPEILAAQMLHDRSTVPNKFTNPAGQTNDNEVAHKQLFSGADDVNLLKSKEAVASFRQQLNTRSRADQKKRKTHPLN